MKPLIAVLIILVQTLTLTSIPVEFIRIPNNDYMMSLNEKECVLLNDEYDNGYLYTSRISSPWLRYVYLWDPIFKSRKPAQFTDVDTSAVWVLTPITNKPHTYFIRNLKYGEFLHPSYFIGRKEIRRNVFTSRYSDDIDNGLKFMWHFKKLDNGMYEIWNAKIYER